MKRALVLGGTKFFGKKLVKNLLETGIEVTIATRGRTEDGFGDRVHRIPIDRTDRSSIENLAFQSWDVVYDQTCYSPKEALDICEVLKGKIGRLIFTSTAAVYDGGSSLIEEQFDPYTFEVGEIKSREHYKGVAGYQLAKRQAEAVYYQKADFPVVAVRLPFVVGRDDYSERLKFYVKKVKMGEEMYIPELDNVLDFITSDEAGQFLHWLGNSDYVGPINGGAKDEATFKQFIEMIEEIVGKKAVLTDNKEATTPYVLFTAFALSVEKAEQLGYKFPEIHEFLPDLIKHYAR
ncbi:NAD-dependent epimerase/dehydratase family protein [Anaerobacillus isosaccharinicus]|uniref:NAD-dependent epimerase/dehydratase family protein n=1 Tax=Anaerobacillus isosaccharinicus TaxID=1532552 RepID=A0A7S7L768_9BACI|nr:NAD-dependent epimerase/dehydratase family protein [Anaerobacillus isosaccharinicus]MBA5586041.1 NAD-dependent epimerase/dehydratase family protein [Anaerobacillus isosaccharinicus]QOY35683.1 NAD-dependent epimerase/dehydratase family protein [Anaerobacillus isosaccharinicus]